jgi:hypothetical protein
MKLEAFVCAVVVLATMSARDVNCQDTQKPASPSGINSKEQRPVDNDQDISLPEDMRIRMELERKEAEHKKFLEDVSQLSHLSTEVSKSFDEHGILSPQELKKIGVMEKLAKRILNHAGGKEADPHKSSGLTLGVAVTELTNAVHDIKESAMARSRYVVSAPLIESSNSVLAMVRLIRHLAESR